MLQEQLDAESKAEVLRLMYGGVVPELDDVSDAAQAKAKEKAFQMLSYSILGRQEQTRAARVTRIGLIQNKWPADTSAPIADQMKEIQARIGDMVDAAGDMGVKVCPRCPALLLGVPLYDVCLRCACPRDPPLK